MTRTGTCWNIWYELTGRRPKEPVIAYVESHDQALVGDKTVMFRLCDAEMYWNMAKDKENLVIDRGMALHKMIRLLTLSLGGEGYLTFMGNEFGHPEWIDFPRAGNGWSYQYCRRQWSLADDPTLRYGALAAFDAAMIALARRCRLFRGKSQQLYISNQEGLIVYRRGGTFFAFNFQPPDLLSCLLPAHRPGRDVHRPTQYGPRRLRRPGPHLRHAALRSRPRPRWPHWLSHLPPQPDGDRPAGGKGLNPDNIKRQELWLLPL